ncbi:MAG: HD domain-containing protein [Bacteroidales bacterium]|nr:HD domain-containing protein [Bacteroidales bacterium]
MMETLSDQITRCLSHPVFQKVAREAAAIGSNVYVVGGFVRDLLLGRDSKDIDFMVVGSGVELAERLSKYRNFSNVQIFKTFGTAMLRYGELNVEIVGARRESYDPQSRKPAVESGTLEDDLRRRDFTINALCISLNEQDFGQLTDRFGGLKDLADGVIRTPLDPDITFSDDPLRMMRAIRFASQLQFKIDPVTLAAIQRNRERIHIISMERITEELNKIILSSQPSVGFRLLDQTRLLEIVFPELHALKGIEERNGIRHKDNFLHTIKVLDNISPNTDNLWLRWATLLHDIAKPQTKRFDPENGWTFHGHNFIGTKMVPQIFRRLKLPLNEKMKYVQKIVNLHMRPVVLAEDTVTDSAVRRLLFEAGDDIEDLMTLCEADITSGIREKVVRYLQNFALVREKLKEIEEKDRVRNWQPPVSGEDIMAVFNIPPSRPVGTIKSVIKDSILDGVIQNNREEAWQLMLKTGQELGLVPQPGTEVPFNRNENIGKD